MRALVEQYAIFKESKGIAGAIKAELDGLFAVVSQRKYLEGLDCLVKKLEDETYRSTVADLYTFPVSQDYFQIFHALAPKIGLLGSVTEDTVAVYILAKSILEDVRVTGDIRAATLPDQPFDRKEALRRTKEIQTMFLEAYKRYHVSLESYLLMSIVGGVG